MRYATDLIGRFFEPQRGSDDNRLCRDFEEAKCTRDNVPLSFFLIYSPTMKLIDGTLNSDILLSNIICFKTESCLQNGALHLFTPVSTVLGILGLKKQLEQSLYRGEPYKFAHSYMYVCVRVTKCKVHVRYVMRCSLTAVIL